jgi:hypothetical protein
MNTEVLLVAVAIVAVAATLTLTAIESITPFKTTTPTPAFAQNVSGNMTLGNLTAGNVTASNVTVPVK